MRGGTRRRLSFSLPALGAAGDVQGGGERDHERRQYPELGDEVQEPLRVAYALPELGGDEQDASDDGEQADKEERLGHDLALLHEDFDGDQQLDEDGDQEHPIENRERRL